MYTLCSLQDDCHHIAKKCRPEKCIVNSVKHAICPIFPPANVISSPPLDGGLVRDGCDALWHIVLDGDSPRVPWGHGLALQVLVCALGLSLLLLCGILLDAPQEVLAGPGDTDVLNTDVNALLEVSVADLSIQDDADGRLGHIVDNTGLSVVDLVGHTLLDGTCASVSPYLLPSCARRLFRTVGHNIHDISDLVDAEVGRERDLEGGSHQFGLWRCGGRSTTHHTLLLEISREPAMLSAKRSGARWSCGRDLRIARTRAKTGGVTHGECVCAWRGEMEVLWS